MLHANWCLFIISTNEERCTHTKNPTLIIINSAWFLCSSLNDSLSKLNKFCVFVACEFHVPFVTSRDARAAYETIFLRQNCKSQLKINALTSWFSFALVILYLERITSCRFHNFFLLARTPSFFVGLHTNDQFVVKQIPLFKCESENGFLWMW